MNPIPSLTPSLFRTVLLSAYLSPLEKRADAIHGILTAMDIADTDLSLVWLDPVKSKDHEKMLEIYNNGYCRGLGFGPRYRYTPIALPELIFEIGHIPETIVFDFGFIDGKMRSAAMREKHVA